MAYILDSKILEKYASVLVNFALNGGKGIKKGEVVLLEVPECAKPILIPLQKAVLKAGGHYVTNYLPDETARHFYELAEEHHLDFFPAKLLKGRVDEIDHSIWIIAEVNKKELEGVSPEKIMRRNKAFKQYKDWRNEKENAGKFSWTLGMYGTDAMAKEAGASIEEYWEQIINACYLDKENPIEEWKKASTEINRILDKLHSMKIDKINIKADKTDLTIKIGKNRKWLGGRGCNIPSFEVFITPDCRYAEGHIEFDQPLYRYGNLITGIKLEFKEGKVVRFSAKSGESILKEMIAVAGADKIGEFSLTDKRLS
ncbi:MAG: aminopeptidase, partial [Nanoarchaeota archaeon]